MFTDSNSDIKIDNVYADSEEDGAGYDGSYDRSHEATADKNLGTKSPEARLPPTDDHSSSRHDIKNIERIFERERQLSEFRRDREFIILSIQSALKSRNHREAKEIVFQYRVAAEIDSEFRRVAELTRSVGLERGAAEDILFILDSTPDDDYAKRCVLYEQLLQIEPSNSLYKKMYLQARRALNLDVQMDRVPRANVGHWVGFIISLFMITGGILGVHSWGVLPSLYAVFSLVAVFLIFPPNWMGLYKKSPRIFSGGGFFLINFIIFILSSLILQ